MGKGFVKGTIIGGLAAGVAALLLAPKSGKETQADIKKAVTDFRGDLLEQMDKVSADLTAKAEALKGVAKDLQGEAKGESKDLLARADVLTKDLKIAAANLAETGAQAKDDVLKNGRHLVKESAEVLKELDKAGRKLADSAKDKVNEVVKEDREAKEAAASKSVHHTNKHEG